MSQRTQNLSRGLLLLLAFTLLIPTASSAAPLALERPNDSSALTTVLAHLDDALAWFGNFLGGAFDGLQKNGGSTTGGGGSTGGTGGGSTGGTTGGTTGGSGGGSGPAGDPNGSP